MSSGTSHPKPTLAVLHIPNTRSIRVVWLLEELGLDYNLVIFPERSNGETKCPLEFITEAGGTHRSPTIKDTVVDEDGKEVEITLQESGAIFEYIMSRYQPPTHTLPSLLPKYPVTDSLQILSLLHFAEGTLATHLHPLLSSTRVTTSALTPHNLSASDITNIITTIDAPHKKKLFEDLEYIENLLKTQVSKGRGKDGKGLFLVGDNLSAADIMVGFAVGLCFRRAVKEEEIREKGWKWLVVWSKGLERREAFGRTMAKTGFGAAGDSVK